MSRKRPAKLSQLTDNTNPERAQVAAGHEPPHHLSLTKIVDDALRSGISPLTPASKDKVDR